MRMKESPPHQLPSGHWSGWPQTREDAIEQNTRFYHPIPCVDHCGRHGHGGLYSSLIYTKTGIHHCCTMVDHEVEYLKAVKNGEPTSPEEAKKKGLDYYWLKKFYKHCGHHGRTTINGRCYDCSIEKIQGKIEKLTKEISPRQKAIAAGEKWYTPDKPCRNGHIAPTRVNNGECRECTEKSLSSPLVQDLYPDMVIDPETAKSLGFKVYRTGEPCKYGHTGWRYITTKACIHCLRSK